MSRSRKKMPIGPLCCVTKGAMKKVKTQANRKIRRVSIEKFVSFKHHKKLENRWSWPDDGKSWNLWKDIPEYKRYIK